MDFLTTQKFLLEILYAFSIFFFCKNVKKTQMKLSLYALVLGKLYLKKKSVHNIKKTTEKNCFFTKFPGQFYLQCVQK